MPEPRQKNPTLDKTVRPDKPSELTSLQEATKENDLHDSLQPQEAPGDVPDIAEEFTTSGSDKHNWQSPPKEDKFLV